MEQHPCPPAHPKCCWKWGEQDGSWRAVTGLDCVWQLALPSHLKCWCSWLEWSDGSQGAEPLLFTSPLCLAGEGSAGVQCLPTTRLLLGDKSSACDKQARQEPWLVGAPQAAHICATHTASPIPPNPLTSHPREHCLQLPLFYKLESNSGFLVSQLSQVLLVYGPPGRHKAPTQSAGCHELGYRQALLWLNCPRGCMMDNCPSILIRAATNSREKRAEHSQLLWKSEEKQWLNKRATDWVSN